MRLPVYNPSIENYKAFRQEILQNPNILNVAASDYIPHSSTNWTRISWEGAAEGDWMKINVYYIDENLIPTYGMTITDGRSFSREFISDLGQVVILNESAAERIGWDQPVGKNIRYGGDYRLNDLGAVKVVGIVKDYHFLSLHNPITPIMLRLFPEDTIGSYISIKISGNDIPATITSIKSKFITLFPGEVFDYQFLDEDFNRMYHKEKKSSRVIFYLASLAIFLACLGLFGLAGCLLRHV